jgi:hypothetical protein
VTILGPRPFTEGLIPEATRRLFATQRARMPRGFRIARMQEGRKPQSLMLVLLKGSVVAVDDADFRFGPRAAC